MNLFLALTKQIKTKNKCFKLSKGKNVSKSTLMCVLPKMSSSMVQFKKLTKFQIIYSNLFLKINRNSPSVKQAFPKTCSSWI